MDVAFPADNVDEPLAKILSDRGLKQFHTAETEKYAHVTFFFNGGRETPFPGEDRLLVPSPKVATYDLKPEMSAPGVTDEAVRRIQSGEYAKDFILENRAGAPTLMSRRRMTSQHSIEVVGEKLRSMMPWIRKNKLVDQTKN